MTKITAVQLKALKTADKGKRIPEGGGFFGKVHVGKDGAVSVLFYYHYRLAGRTRDYGCGSWPDTDLSTIRAAYEDARREVREGVDPVDRRQAEQAAKKAAAEKLKEEGGPLTLRKLFDTWHVKVLKSRSDGGSEPLRAFERDVFPALGKTLAADVTTSQIETVIERIKERGALTQAAATYGLLRRLFTWGVVKKLVADNPVTGITRKEVGGASGERERTLPDPEIRVLFERLAPGASGLTETVRRALLVLLGTGARSGELLRGRRAHVDLTARTWYIPPEHSKTRKSHLIYLSDWVLPHMAALLDLAGNSEWLMPDPRDPAQAVQRAVLINATADRQAAYYPDRKTDGRSLNFANALTIGPERWTPHDLRRTAATKMGDLGVFPDVIDRCLNHVIGNKVRRTYQRQILQGEQFAAWVRLGEHLQVLSSPNVVTLAEKQTA